MFSEDEVAYIALHIGAAIERFSSNNRKMKRVMLVCGSGHATIRMIEAQLNSTFKDRMIITQRLSYNEFLNNSLENIDFIVSTVPIKDEVSVPVVHIELPLLISSFEKIEEYISDSIVPFNLEKYFDENLFLSNHKADSKNDIIEFLVGKLYQQGLVDGDFLESVLQRENLASTLMDDMIAIPHPLTARSSQTKIAVAILDKPVEWSDNQTAQIILLLAIAESDRNHLEFLYEAFVDITSNPKIQSQIIKVQTLDHFLNILHNAKKI